MSVQPLELTDGPWTAREVTRALFGHFTGQSWAPMVEVNVQPEERLRDALADRSGAAQLPDEVWERTRGRRVDMLLARRARKPGIGDIERLAIEVKVSRADFLTDVRNPFKQKPARDLAHRHAFAVPDGLVDPSEVPADSGLIVVRRLSHNQHAVMCEWKKRAPYSKVPPGPLPDWMILTFAYRAAWAEANTKGLTANIQRLGDDPGLLRMEVQRLEADLQKATRAAERANDKARAWRDAYAAAGDLPCATCGERIRPKGLRGGWWSDWTHRTRAADATCEGKRTELAEHNARVAYDQALATGDLADWQKNHAARQFPSEPWRIFLAKVPVAPFDADDQEPDTDE